MVLNWSFLINSLLPRHVEITLVSCSRLFLPLLDKIFSSTRKWLLWHGHMATWSWLGVLQQQWRWTVMRGDISYSHKHYLISHTVIPGELGKLTSSICGCLTRWSNMTALCFFPWIIITLDGGRSQPIKSEHSQTSPTITDSVISIIPAECLPL